MKKPLTDEDLLERAAIDGKGLAFATAAFALVNGARRAARPGWGARRLVAALGPIAALTGLATVGLLLRSTRISRLTPAGGRFRRSMRALPVASLAAGLFMPFVLPVAGRHFAQPASSSGSARDWSWPLCVVGPLLRKTGAFSVPDLLAARFPKLALRLGAVVVVAAAAVLIYLAGL